MGATGAAVRLTRGRPPRLRRSRRDGYGRGDGALNPRSGPVRAPPIVPTPARRRGRVARRHVRPVALGVQHPADAVDHLPQVHGLPPRGRSVAFSIQDLAPCWPPAFGSGYCPMKQVIGDRLSANAHEGVVPRGVCWESLGPWAGGPAAAVRPPTQAMFIGAAWAFARGRDLPQRVEIGSILVRFPDPPNQSPEFPRISPVYGRRR
jgi:hypothetical protein